MSYFVERLSMTDFACVEIREGDEESALVRVYSVSSINAIAPDNGSRLNVATVCR